ncbi:MAG: spore cortex biosynthesis protein YabQ [Oscillospiraceae bacterium]|nr:spore cortex biosynthesis protein YabQ [Oscillospiraceae bacterium]
MEQALGSQGMLLACTLLTGLGLGALYDLLRVIRERVPAAVGVAADALYCLVFAAALFLLGMGPARGEGRLYMPPLALAGAGLWFFFFGSAARRGFRRALDALAALLRPPKRLLATLAGAAEKNFKKGFSFAGKSFTIALARGYDKLRIRTPGRAEESNDEAQPFQHTYENCGPGPDHLRGGHAGGRPGPHRGG